MKKALLWLLLLTIPFTFGCPSPRNDNAVNTNAANTNTGNTNQGIAPLARDPKNKAIQIALYTDNNGTRKVAIAPESIYLDSNKGHRLRFSIFNGTDDDISNIKIVLTRTSSTGDGFEGGDASDGGLVFKRGRVETGTEDDTDGRFRKPKRAPGTGAPIEKYTYKVIIDGVEQPVTKDSDAKDQLYAPQIEIGG